MIAMTLQEKLLEIFNRLYACYGPQRWWPGDTPFEVMVGAVLTQAASWTNVEKAIANLIAADALSPPAIRRLDEAELARLIYPSGYYNAKARKLKALARYLGERFDDDIAAMSRVDMEALRAELLGVYGIGEETADDIVLYAAGLPSFVVDSYTRRAFFRLGVAPERGPYAAYRALFMESLPSDAALFGEYHALIVRHGKEVCKKRPECARCPLRDICPAGNPGLNRIQMTAENP